jgi:hypothetical protein
MVQRRALISAALAGDTLCCCASSQVDTKPNLVGDIPPPTDNGGVVTGALPGSGYQLNAEELGYDCKKLTGTMQIRILQIRGYDTNRKASSAARGLQTFATPIWGGTKEGVDPDGQYQRDRAMLEAYNRQLAAKQCPTFDLARELAATEDTTPTPIPRTK